MSRAGFADKSHLMRQIEKYADIYTSRVANLLPYTPYKQFLCQRQSLAHSTTSYSGRPLMEHWVIEDEYLESGLEIDPKVGRKPTWASIPSPLQAQNKGVVQPSAREEQPVEQQQLSAGGSHE